MALRVDDWKWDLTHLENKEKGSELENKEKKKAELRKKEEINYRRREKEITCKQVKRKKKGEKFFNLESRNGKHF